MASSENGHNLQVVRMNHSDKLARAVESMFFDETLCDVTICCHGQSVKAHRVILAATSLYFKELFANTLPGQYPIVFVSSVPINDLNAILEYIYKGEVTIPQTQIESLVRSADTLGIIGLGKVSLENQEIWKNLNSVAEAKSTSVKNSSDPIINNGENLQNSVNGSKQGHNSISTPASTSTSIPSSSKRGRKRKSANETNVVNVPKLPPLNAQPKNIATSQNGVTLNDSNESILNNNDIQVAEIPEETTPVVRAVEHTPQLNQVNSYPQTQVNETKQNTNGHMEVSSKDDSSSSPMLDVNENSSGSTSKENFGKITKSKLRSWSQQITQKNLAARLSKFGPTTSNHLISSSPSVLIESNSLKVKKLELSEPSLNSSPSSSLSSSTPIGISSSNPQIKLEARPRGRPRKIMIPQLNPIPINNEVPKVNGTVISNVNNTITLKNLKCEENNVTNNEHVLLGSHDESGPSPVVKRGRGRPPNHSKLISKPNPQPLNQSQPHPLSQHLESVINTVPQVAL